MIQANLVHYTLSEINIIISKVELRGIHPMCFRLLYITFVFEKN